MSIKVLSRLQTLAATPAQTLKALQKTLDKTLKVLAPYPLSLAYCKKTFTPNVLHELTEDAMVNQGVVIGLDDRGLDILSDLPVPSAKARKEAAEILDMVGDEESIDAVAMFFAGNNKK